MREGPPHPPSNFPRQYSHVPEPFGTLEKNPLAANELHIKLHVQVFPYINGEASNISFNQATTRKPRFFFVSFFSPSSFLSRNGIITTTLMLTDREGRISSRGSFKWFRNGAGDSSLGKYLHFLLGNIFQTIRLSFER